MGKKISTPLLCRRYASALLDLAEKEKSSVRVAEELAQIAGLGDTSPAFRTVMKDPTLNRSEVARAMEKILTDAQASRLLVNFCVALAGNGRLRFLPEIAAAFHTLAAEHRGELRAEIISAAPLQAAQVNHITDNLGKAVGRKVVPVTKVDQRVLGGFTVKLGSRMLDASLAGKLDRLKLHLKMESRV